VVVFGISKFYVGNFWNFKKKKTEKTRNLCDKILLLQNIFDKMA
jgi:hypothetical protein